MPATERPCSMLASRLPWLSIAARGAPAVPLVNISTAKVVGLDVDDVDGVGVDELGEVADRPRHRWARWRSRGAPSRHRGAVDSVHAAAAAGSTTTTLAPTVAISLLDLGRRALRVERNGDRAEAEHREVRLDEVQPVAAQQGDAIAAPDTEAGQATADAGRPGRASC